MLIGYMRASKSDGTQTVDLQRDTLMTAGVAPERLYEDLASGRNDNRLGLNAPIRVVVQKYPYMSLPAGAKRF